jgi:D-psicose/D-tagatose/L-ribulose 3-epimerase
MRLAISNIAWPSGADAAVAPLLIEHGAEGVELAPTKVWPRPLEATAAEVWAYRDSWERRGLRIVALQALLFGRPELTLFGDAAARRRAVDHLKGMISLAAALGAGPLVFGSPGNRRVGTLPRAEAEAIAITTFRELGECAHRSGVTFCIEPNPPAYGCDFVTTAEEGADLVERVDCPGFGLHLDTGAMTLAADPVASVLARSSAYWSHFHVSEPGLAPVGRGTADHRAISGAVRRAGYTRWISIEMKEADTIGASLPAIREALGYVCGVYFAGWASPGERTAVVG